VKAVNGVASRVRHLPRPPCRQVPTTWPSLFVDEGFGSLDEDTLEEVMDVLDGLRCGGRTVGLVSHVADLRQRIPAQIEVVKGRAGSHLTVLAG
jgi:exonuclease SbcC